MKAAQIERYSKDIRVNINDIPVPEIGDQDILLRVKAAAVNPVDILNLTGAIRLIQDYRMPIHRLGAFAECAAIPENAAARMPDGFDYASAAAVPLTGLTAYQAITEELHAKPGETVFIPGGSGSWKPLPVSWKRNTSVPRSTPTNLIFPRSATRWRWYPAAASTGK